MVKKKNKNPLVMIINGPNLNMLGQRETAVYGSETLFDINSKLEQEATHLNMTIETFQSNSEGAIVDKIQQGCQNAAGLVYEMQYYCWTSP